MWLNPSGKGHNPLWWHPWPENVTSELVFSTKPNGTIANSYLELTALVLHEATLLKSVTKYRMAAPRSGFYNTPTSSLSMREASMINLVVADLLRIRALYSRKFFLDPSVFYHLVQENYMANDASRLFYLSYIEFLAHVSVVHPQLYGLCQISLPLPEMLSCMISTLRRKM